MVKKFSNDSIQEFKEKVEPIKVLTIIEELNSWDVKNRVGKTDSFKAIVAVY